MLTKKGKLVVSSTLQTRAIILEPPLKVDTMELRLPGIE